MTKQFKYNVGDLFMFSSVNNDHYNGKIGIILDVVEPESPIFTVHYFLNGKCDKFQATSYLDSICWVINGKAYKNVI